MDPITDAQRAFIAGAEALGATQPAHARPLSELPRLSRRELDALVEAGLVREAADWRYYVFRQRDTRLAPRTVHTTPEIRGVAPWTFKPGRVIRLFLFWVFIILIPVLFLQLTARR